MDETIAALRAIGEPTRLRILVLLSQGELAVSELVRILGQSQPRVSRHLKLLSETGLVERLPEGAWVFYRLAERACAEQALVQAAIAAAPPADAVLQSDAARLAQVKATRAQVASAYFRRVAGDWGRIRALHSGDSVVEAAMCEIVGRRSFSLMVDIGTGTGRMLEVFADQCRRAVGVDLSHDMLTVARANLEAAGLAKCSVRHGDLYALPFASASADFVVVHQVLHYLDHPGGAVMEAARVLAPQGLLVIVDFAPHAVEFLRDEHAHRRLGFGDDDVFGWFEAAGLDVVAQRAVEPRHAQTGDGLTVKLWSGRPRQAQQQAERRAAGDAA